MYNGEQIYVIHCERTLSLRKLTHASLYISRQLASYLFGENMFYSISKFQLYNKITLTIFYIISQTLFILKLSWYASTNLSLFLPPSDNRFCILYFYEFDFVVVVCFRFHIKLTPRSVSLFLAYFAQRNALKRHPRCCKWQGFSFLMAS